MSGTGRPTHSATTRIVDGLRRMEESDVPARLVDLLLDGIVMALAIWAVVWQAGAAFGWSLPVIGLVFLFPVGPAVFAVLRSGAEMPQDRGADSATRSSPSVYSVIGFVVLAAGAAVLFVVGQATMFWVVGVGAMGWAWWIGVRGRPGSRPRPLGPSKGWVWVVALSILFALLSAMTSEWDGDNTYYFDRAIALTEWDGAVPVGVDTLHSEGDLVSAFAENDLSAYEPAAAIIARVTGVHPVSVLSFVLHPLLALLAVLAVWRLARIVASPYPWLVAVSGSIVLLVLSNSSGLGRAVFSPRMGRVWLVGLIVPSIIGYAFEAASREGWRWPALVAAAAVAGASLSLSALLVLPGAIVIGVVSGWAGRPASITPALAAAAIVVADWGWLVAWASVMPRVAAGGPGAVLDSVEVWAWGLSFGSLGAVPVLLIVVVLTAWALLPPGRARRLAVAIPGVTFAFTAPPIVSLLHESPAAVSTRRLIWMLPLAVACGLVVAGMALRIGSGRGMLIAAAASIGLVALVPRLPMVEFGAVAWDVPSAEEEAARRLVALAPSGTTVVAPWAVSAVLPIVSSEVYPVAARRASNSYLGRLDSRYQADIRFDLVRYSQRGFRVEPAELSSWIDAIDVSAICFDPDAQFDRVRPTMHSLGWQTVGSDDLCEYWVPRWHPGNAGTVGS